MALNINGTTGISGVDGSNASPAIQGTDSNTGVSFGSDTVNINTGGATRYSIDSSGNIQAGGANPVFTGSSLGSLKIAAPDGGSRYFFGEIGNSASAQLSLYDSSDSQKIRISANASDATFFNSSGVMIGDTGSTRIGEPKLHVLNGGSGNNVASFFFNTTDDRDAIIIRHNGADGGNNRIMIKLANADGNAVGNIISNGSSTSYNTSSDYRLKENVTAISDGITRLKTLKPYRFNFKADASTTVDGFFAHEVTAVPEAISGTKDETENILYTEEDTIPSGKKVGDVKETVPKYQGIDQAKLVPLLTAALQEAVAKIEVLETKVVALEAA